MKKKSVFKRQLPVEMIISGILLLCVCWGMSACVCIHVEARGHSRVWFLRKSSGSPGGLGWRGTKPQRFTIVASSHQDYKHPSKLKPFSPWVLGLKLEPHAYVACRAFPTLLLLFKCISQEDVKDKRVLRCIVLG